MRREQMWFAVAVVFLAAITVVVEGDLTGTSLYAGDCVCATTNVNGRDRAGLSGSILTTIPGGRCGNLVTNSYINVDGYTWYKTSYNGQEMWVAGKYLSKSYSCPSSSSSSSGSSGGGACSTSQQQKACTLLQKHKSGVLRLATNHPGSGKSDSAYAYNNIEDMCNGRKAARSSYECNECKSGPAPGGSVCLIDSVLSYLIRLVDGGRVIVNELAGACHSCTSKHYQGRAVDLHKDSRTDDYVDTCRAMGGVAIRERNHVHCQFNN